MAEAQLPLFADDSGDPPPAVATPLVRRRPRRVNRPRPLRVEDPVPAFLDSLVAAGKARHTVASVRFDVQQLVHFVAPASLSELKLRQLRLFVRWLATDRGNKPSSVRRKIATLKSFSRFLFESGQLSSDVAARLAYPPARLQLPPALNAEDAQRLLRAALEHSLAWGCVVGLLLETGIKRDELLALQRDDVVLAVDDPRDSFIRLRRRREAQRTRLRTVPVSTRLHSILGEQILVRPLDGQRLFQLSARGVDFIVESCGHLAGLKVPAKVTPQLLRDTFAIRRMTECLQRERALAARDPDEEALKSARSEHNQQLLHLLGLSPGSAVAQRYRDAIERQGQPQWPET